jgi:repressor of nif and glnA expression
MVEKARAIIEKDRYIGAKMIEDQLEKRQFYDIENLVIY